MDEQNNAAVTPPANEGADKAAADKAPAAPAEDKKEGTTPDEVAKILHLPKAAKESSDEKAKSPEKPEPPAPDGKGAGSGQDKTPPADEAEDDDTEEDDDDGKRPVNQPEEKDFSFTVEDAEGNKFTIKPGDNLEEVLKDFTPRSNGQVLQILRELGTMEANKAAYEAEQAQAAVKSERQERVKAYRDSWNKEIEQLQAENRIPKTEAGKDNERVAEVFKFMAEENQKRTAAGRQTLNSFEDALDKLELRESKAAKAEAEKQEKETARKNGALVGGSSAPAGGSNPVYRAGSARNANEAIRSLGLLK